MAVPALSAARHVYQADARVWLAENPAPDGASVVTSLPDVSEVPPHALDGWRSWFVDTAKEAIAWTPRDGVAIFFQSDIRHDGIWIDKGYLVMRAAEEAAASVVWHKIVCRKPPGTVSLGRPSYSHMLCIARDPIAVREASRTRREAEREDERPRIDPHVGAGPDVLPDAGEMTWSRAMGVAACVVACRYLKASTGTRVVVDPFCGHGTILAVANAFGLDGIGVDLSAKRCRAARNLALDPDLGGDTPLRR